MTAEKGFTIVEAMLAAGVLLIGAMGMATVISDVLVLTTSTNDTTLALQASRSKMDQMWSQAAQDFGTLYVRYNSDTSDDPDANSPGDTFDVAGLAPKNSGDHVGKITFFLVESTAATQLGLKNNESQYDLDGDVPPPEDGAIDIDRNGEYNEADQKLTDPWSSAPPSHQILPVRIEVRWIDPTAKDTTGGGPREREYKIESILYPR